MSQKGVSWLIDNDKVDEVEFCRVFCAEKPLKCIGGRFYGLNGEVSGERLRAQIGQIVGELIRTGFARVVNNVFEALKLYCYSEPLPLRENKIYLGNGTLSTDGKFTSKNDFCLNRLNVSYNPETSNDPVHFLAFLSELLAPEDILTLQEYLGYCLIPSTKGQAALFIIGNGGEGKSRLGIVLHSIFGDSMIFGDFHRVETDRFFRYNLVGKLLMVDDDLQLSALKSTGYIKTIITAETPIDVEAKGKQSEQAMP